MTIDEAIEELTKQLRPKYSTPHTRFHNAMKLGIEALKNVKGRRKGVYIVKKYRLPGETGE